MRDNQIYVLPIDRELELPYTRWGQPICNNTKQLWSMQKHPQDLHFNGIMYL